jgi:hypothetical protein
MAVEWRVRRIVYIPIPKCACTTLKSVFHLLNYGSEFVPGHDQEVDNIHRQYAGTPEFRLNRLALYANWRRLVVVRDPVARFLSAYTSRVVGFGELGHKFIGGSGGALGVPIDPDIHEFIASLHIYQAISPLVRHHFAPQACFAGPDLSAYTDVYRVEELGELHQMLELEYGQPFPMPQFQRSPVQFATDMLSVRELGEIRDRYAGDYALLRRHYSFARVLMRRTMAAVDQPVVALGDLIAADELCLTGPERFAGGLTVYATGCQDGVTIRKADTVTITTQTNHECLVSFEKAAPRCLRLGDSYELIVVGRSASPVMITCFLRYQHGEHSRYLGTTRAIMQPGRTECSVLFDTELPETILGQASFEIDQMRLIIMFEATCGMAVELTDLYLRAATEWPDQSGCDAR